MLAGCLITACLLAACGDDTGSGGSGPGGGGTGGASTTSSSAGGGSGVCTPGETEACAAYGGPEGTEGVGVCAASRRECLPDGSGFGACSDEVQPSLENCATVGDDDCDGSAPACTLTHLWSRGVAGSGQDEVMDVAIDGDGNVVVVGYSNGAIDLGGGQVGQTGEDRCFVAKYAASGAHLWSHRYGGAGAMRCHAVAVDTAGSVYFTANLLGSADLGGGPLTTIGLNVRDVVVAKLDPSGAHVWSRLYGSSSSDQNAFSIAVDALARPVLVGSFNGFASFGTEGVNSAGATDVFALALEDDGSLRWIKRFGGTGNENVSSVALAPNGDLVIGGRFSNTVDFGGGALVSLGSFDAFVLRLDSAGEHVSSLAFGSSHPDMIHDVDVGPDGDMYLAARVLIDRLGPGGEVQFGGQTLTGFGNDDVLIARLDPQGAPRWSKFLGATGFDEPSSLGLDPVGNLTVTGYFYGPVDFGGGTLTSLGVNTDMFIAKYDPSGAHLVSARFGSVDSEVSRRLAVDGSGSVVVAGNYETPFSFGGPELPGGSTVTGDAFIAKFSP